MVKEFGRLQGRGRESIDRGMMPQAFWRAFAELGLEPSAVLERAHLPATLHLSGSPFVATAQIFAIFTAAEQLARDAAFAIRLVKAFDRSGHQPAFLAACYAADYRDALYRIARFKRLSACEKFLISESDGELSIVKEWPFAQAPEPALLVDVSFAFAIEIGRKGTGHDIAPVRVELVRDGPRSDALGTYFGCPIRYGAPRNVLVLKSIDLDRRFPSHNVEFLELLTPALAARLSDLEVDGSFAEHVTRALKRSLASGRPSMATIARDLGVSDRTLQRRITEEGTTFRTLLDDARKELVEPLLLDPSISIDEVAVLAGYQEPSAFYRAFKSWHGVTPHRWREKTAGTAQDR